MAKGRTLRQMVDSGSVAPPSSQLSKEEKEALADAGTPFSIVSAAIGEGTEYGGYYEVAIMLDGKERMFQLSMHPKREAFMADLMAAFPGDPIDNCRLVNKGGSKGSPFLTIEPVEE